MVMQAARIPQDVAEALAAVRDRGPSPHARESARTLRQAYAVGGMRSLRLQILDVRRSLRQWESDQAKSIRQTLDSYLWQWGLK